MEYGTGVCMQPGLRGWGGIHPHQTRWWGSGDAGGPLPSMMASRVGQCHERWMLRLVSNPANTSTTIWGRHQWLKHAAACSSTRVWGPSVEVLKHAAAQ